MAKSGLIGKMKTIAGSFLTPLPVGEDWYEKRLEICNTCELNTKNIEYKNLSVKDQIQKATVSNTVCDSGNHCTACSCCIERKCATKTETCGLIKLKKKPKWNALKVELNDDKDITFENLNPELGDVVGKSNVFEYDLGTVKEDSVAVSFVISRSSGFDLKDFAAGCSCTVSEHIVLDNKSVKFNLNINTTKFRKGALTNKTFTVNYFDKPKSYRSITVNFKIHKKL